MFSVVLTLEFFNVGKFVLNHIILYVVDRFVYSVSTHSTSLHLFIRPDVERTYNTVVSIDFFFQILNKFVLSI